MADDSDNVAQPGDKLSASRARADRDLEQARLIAEHLRAHPGCFVESAALAAGMVPRTYYRRMAGDTEECLAFQRIVGPALQEHAEKLLEEARRDIESAEGGSSAYVNWHKWLLPKRHPRLFGEQPAEQKVELTGKDGGPVQFANMSTPELLELYLGTGKSEDEGE